MNLMSFLFPAAYIGQGQITGQQQQIEWNAANQRNDLLNQGLATQTAAQTDSWNKLQQEQQMIQMASRAQANQIPQAVAANGAPPPATAPYDISAQAGMAAMSAPPPAAVVPSAAPQAPSAQSMAGMAAGQPNPVAVAAGAAPAPAPAQAPATPAQDAATTAGVAPASPKDRLAAVAAGQTPPAAAGTTPPVAALAALPLQKFAPAIDAAMSKAQQLLDVQWAAGDLPRAQATMQEILHTAPQLAAETRAQAQLQMDQLKYHQFGIQQSAAILGNPGIKTVADLQNAFQYAQTSGAMATFSPEQQQMIQQRVQGATSDDQVPEIVAGFRSQGMTANQQAVDLTKQVNADARAKESKIRDNLAQIKEDWDQKYKTYQMQRQATVGKTGANAVSVPKNDITIIDALAAPAYFGGADQSTDDPSYQRFRETVGEDAMSRMQANKALKLEQATQLAINAAKERGDFTPATTKDVPGMLYGTNKEPVPAKFAPVGMTPDKPIPLQPTMKPSSMTTGRYYTIPSGPRKGTYQWDGKTLVAVE